MPLPAPTYRFGPYEVRLRSRQVYKDGIRLKLRPQPFQVLQLFVQRAGDVVTRAELRELLWSKETFVDFEHGLNTAIKELRSALNDSAAEPRYIETLPRLGYRLIAPVAASDLETVPASPLPPGAGGDQPVAVEPAPRKLPRGLPKWIAAVAAACLALGALAANRWWSLSRGNRAGDQRLMLAVLPFENLTGDPAQEYFSDGMTEEMITELGRFDPKHLGVIGRASVMRFKGDRDRQGRIGRELGVQYLLEGSVRRDSDKVRVAAQLIETKSQTNVWSREYDRNLSDLLTLQRDIAREIAGEIRITLGDPQPNRGPAAVSPSSDRAHDLYLRGLYFWNKRTPAGFDRAIEFFGDAVKEDPSYARAYAGLADVYALASGYAGVSPSDARPKAREAARRAIELDDTLAVAHTARAVVAQDFDWDWQTAEAEYRRSVQLDPNYATAHHWYAEFLALMGRFDEARVEMERARELEPLSLIVAADDGVILYYERRYDLAIERLRAVLDMEPRFPRAAKILDAYVAKGMYAEVMTVVSEWQRHEPASAWLWGQTAYFDGRAGRQADARRALQKLEQFSRDHAVDPFVFATAYIGMNDKEQALAWLERAYEQHSTELVNAKVDPIYDPLRGDPRFRDLLVRMHLG